MLYNAIATKKHLPLSKKIKFYSPNFANFLKNIFRHSIDKRFRVCYNKIT
jgi:hypothetical protein